MGYIYLNLKHLKFEYEKIINKNKIKCSLFFSLKYQYF